MTGNNALRRILERIGDSVDGVVYLAEEELASWPTGAVVCLTDAGLLRPASPAESVVCDGCERQCAMPVEMQEHFDGPIAFVFCRTRDDVGRVPVPFDRLRRHQSSGQAIAAYLARALGTRETSIPQSSTRNWPVGIVRGRRSAYAELAGDGALVMKLAGHTVALTDVLTLQGRALKVDRQRLIQCVDNPVAGGGTPESAAARGERVARLAQEKGVPATAAELGISAIRVKQITAAHRRRTKSQESSKG